MWLGINIYTKQLMRIDFKTMKPSRLLTLRPSAPRNIILKHASMKRKKSHLQRRNTRDRIWQLREEMAEISKEHRCIREGQRKVRERFEEIQLEREKLKQETELIARDSISIQAKLNLMFRIIKARSQNDSALVDQLSRSLRDLISKPN